MREVARQANRKAADAKRRASRAQSTLQKQLGALERVRKLQEQAHLVELLMQRLLADAALATVAASAALSTVLHDVSSLRASY